VRLEKALPLNSKRVLPVCTGGQKPVPPEDCEGARADITDENDSNEILMDHPQGVCSW
jgi:hypothetical protein